MQTRPDGESDTDHKHGAGKHAQLRSARVQRSKGISRVDPEAIHKDNCQMTGGTHGVRALAQLRGARAQCGSLRGELVVLADLVNVALVRIACLDLLLKIARRIPPT